MSSATIANGHTSKGKVGRNKWGVNWDLTARERAIYARIPSEMDYVPDTSFACRSAERKYYADEDSESRVPHWTYFPEVPEDNPTPRKRTILKRCDEQYLFLRYNYARCRLSTLIASQHRRATPSRAHRMVMWFERAMKVRAALVRANMALVLAMAKRTRIPSVEFGELVSEGNMALLRSVEKFDVSRGYKFSTYSCRAILKSFNRLATRTARYRRRFPIEFDPEMERSDYDEKQHEHQHEMAIESLREVLGRNRAKLSDVEHRIVIERFGIGVVSRKRTLAEVGRIVGLTNERVRQIQNLALGKIRTVLDEEYLIK